MAGPDSPPVRKLSLGLYAFRSIDMPTKVLTAHSASAPADSTARAITPMSVTIGVSFTHTGSFVRLRTASVNRGCGAGVVSEIEPALLHVGARDVDLEPGHAGHAIKP